MDESKLNLDTVPDADQPYVKRLRRFLCDTAELNTLEGIQESTDIELYDALLDTLDEINYEFTPQTSYESFKDIPAWTLLRSGATLRLLTSKGILSARNTLTYNDAGGVTVSDLDKYGRYMQYFNLLNAKYIQSVTKFKISVNAESCYGGVYSDYIINNWQI